MTITPTLDAFLASMEYPATRDDLLREAARDGLPASDCAVLEALPDRSFGARWHIKYHLAQGTLADALFGRPLVNA